MINAGGVKTTFKQVDMINIHWSTIVYVIVIALMIIRMIKIRHIDWCGQGHVFWLTAIILFTAIWGGVFWW